MAFKPHFIGTDVLVYVEELKLSKDEKKVSLKRRLIDRGLTERIGRGTRVVGGARERGVQSEGGAAMPQRRWAAA